jgi:hypothetical protein
MTVLPVEDMVMIICAPFQGTSAMLTSTGTLAAARVAACKVLNAGGTAAEVAATLFTGILSAAPVEVSDVSEGAVLDGLIAGALQVMRIQLRGLGYDMKPSVVEDPTFEELLNDILSGDAGVDTVAGWASARATLRGAPTAAQLEFDLGPIVPETAIRAYVASALTDLSDDEYADLRKLSSTIKRALDEDGISTHCPTDYTDPRTTSDDPPHRVSRIDYAAVLRSDLIVFIANRPSSGAGKELVWAERNGNVTLLLASLGARPSRLVTGTTCHMTGLAGDQTPEALAMAIRGFVQDHRAELEAHARSRSERLATHQRLLEAMFAVLPVVLQRLADGPHWLTQERAEEIVASVDHVANASLAEIQEFCSLASLDMAQLLGSSPNGVTSATDVAAALLGQREASALASAALIRNWPSEVVIDLIRRVVVERPLAGVAYRLNLRDSETWMDLHDAR